MKVYLAAVLYNDFRNGSPVYNRLDDAEKRVIDSIPHVLDSYHYIGNERMVKRIRDNGRKLFLDSGAFSAYTQGAEIDIGRYCRYIKENKDLFDVISVLDAIGDPDQTWRNLQIMEQHGLKALPCFHYGEPLEVLDYYASNYDYITIGGMVPISTPQLKIWLDDIWAKHLTLPDGTPKLKVHGFGLTSVPLMTRYPWFSVDSSSWVQLGGMGNIFFPQFGTIAVSEHAPQRKEEGKHIDNLPQEHKDVLMNFINAAGFDIERLRTLHLSRKSFNALTYGTILPQELSHDRFVQTQQGLF